MDTRIRKQFIIACLLVLAITGSTFLFWRIFFYQAPSCFDHVKNQDETAIDCGGVCGACIGSPQSLRLGETAIVAGEQGSFDAVFRIENPNLQWGVKTVPYTLVVEASDGTSLGERKGNVFLLPLETTAVVEQTIATKRIPVSVHVTVGSPDWIAVPDEVQNDQLVVLTPTYARLGTGPDAAEVHGIVRNDAPFTYDRVAVSIVVSDQNGNVVGARSTEMRTLVSGERREFRVAWRTPLPLNGEPKLEIFPRTNVFENENFVQQHGTHEQFQEF